MKKKMSKWVLMWVLFLNVGITGCKDTSTLEDTVDLQEDISVQGVNLFQEEDLQKNGLHELPTDSQGTAAPGIDVDLTVMSSVMVYAEVYNMTLAAPEDYIGKTVKMQGEYNTSYYDVTDQYYHWVVIPDATECCTSGIEFIWEGEHRYPEDYPENGTEVVICGVFRSYEELGVTYYYISAEDFKII